MFPVTIEMKRTKEQRVIKSSAELPKNEPFTLVGTQKSKRHAKH